MPDRPGDRSTDRSRSSRESPSAGAGEGDGEVTSRDASKRRRGSPPPRTGESSRGSPPGAGRGESARGTGRPQGWTGFAYDVASSVLAVLLVGAFLFAVSGVWPPLVAVESGSMVPNMEEGDLVFVMEEHRFAGPGAVEDTGVVPSAVGAETDYRTFGGYGDVIVYEPDGRTNRVPIIHRAMFWVDNDERWYDEANKQFVGTATSCQELQNCPAPDAGFITKGDNNDRYDQANGLSDPVQPAWIVGTAEVRVPGLGWIRLGSP